MTDETDFDDGAEMARERAPMAAWKKAVAALSLVLGIVGMASGGTPLAAPRATPGQAPLPMAAPEGEDVASLGGAQADPGALGVSSLTAADPSSGGATSAG
ncbi:MAG: hypothetical protein VXZ39_04595, partial [Planctomycetota bacterium]|nr:hypothetical protein [Planctomycetota bacterium]